MFRLSCDFWLNTPVPITKISPSNNIVHEAKSLIEFVRKKVLILIAYQPNNVSCILLFAFSFSTTNSHRFSQARLRVEILRKFESKNRFSTRSIPNLRSNKRFSALQKILANLWIFRQSFEGVILFSSSQHWDKLCFCESHRKHTETRRICTTWLNLIDIFENDSEYFLSKYGR